MVHESVKTNEMKKSQENEEEIQINEISDQPIPIQNYNYSIRNGIYCLLVTATTSISSLWTRNAMSSFYGFGIASLINNPDYAM